MDSGVKFTTLQIQNSVTYDSANSNAVDVSAPLSFLKWAEYVSDASSDPKIGRAHV